MNPHYTVCLTPNALPRYPRVSSHRLLAYNYRFEVASLLFVTSIPLTANQYAGCGIIRDTTETCLEIFAFCSTIADSLIY